MSNNNLNKNNSLSSYAQNAVKEKMKINQRIDVEKANDDNSHKPKKEHKSIKEWWKSQRIDSDYLNQWKDWKKQVNLLLTGCFFGGNSVFYGSSPSLFATHRHNYNEIVNGWCDFFTPKSLRDFFNKLLWTIPFLIGFLICFIATYAISSAIYNTGFNLIFVFLMASFSVIGITWFVLDKKTRPVNFFSKQNVTQSRFNLKLILFIAVFLFMFGACFAARYAWGSEFPLDNLTINQYINLTNTKNVSSIVTSSSLQTGYALQILIGTFFTGLTTFIPGASGTIALAILGSNAYLNTAFRFAFAGYDSGIANLNTSWAWSTIVIGFIGLILGFCASAFSARYLTKNFYNEFDAIKIAFASVLFITIFLSLRDIDTALIQNDSLILTVSLVLLFAPTLIGVGLLSWFHRTEFSTICTSFKLHN